MSKRQAIKRRRKAQVRRQKRILFCCGLAVVVLLLFYIVAYVAVYRQVNQLAKDTIAENLFIGEVDVSGLKKKEAKKAIQEKLDEYGQKTMALTIGDQKTKISVSSFGISVKDEDQLIKEAMEYGKKGSVWKRHRQLRRLKKEKKVLQDTFVVDTEATRSVLEEQVIPLEKQPVDATITHTEDGFEITDEQDGIGVDMDASIQKIEEYLNKEWDRGEGALQLQESVQKPAIKRADLEAIQDELGSYATDAGTGQRVTNLRRGSELIHGTVLMPGEEFSVEQATLPYTEENGYVDGGAYENGEVVQSIAGGICQVSTTLYNAVLYSELEVTERYAHSIIVSYVEPSRDAAVAEGLKDFKFQNSTEAPILIEGYITDSGRLEFHIYGKETRPESRRVEFESETLERNEYRKKYVEDSDSAIGSMTQSGTAINGRTARLWKVVYENDEEVSRDVINNSTYNPTEIKINVGTAANNAEASSLVRSAISTQDEGKIKEAIAAAQALQ